MNLNLEKEMKEIQKDYPEFKGITFEKLINMLQTKPFEYVKYDIDGELHYILPVECGELPIS